MLKNWSFFGDGFKRKDIKLRCKILFKKGDLVF